MRNFHDGGEAILEAMRNLGVDYLISSPGSEWPSVWEALARQKLNGNSGPIYLDLGHEILAVTMAAAYTKITGRMQAVLLHAGAGLMQGSMAVHSARTMEVPMLVMSGETLGYAEGDFDPGAQWYRQLSIVGGPQRMPERREMGAAGARAGNALRAAWCAPARCPNASPRGRLPVRSDGDYAARVAEARRVAQGTGGAEISAASRRHRARRGDDCQGAQSGDRGRKRRPGPRGVRRPC